MEKLYNKFKKGAIFGGIAVATTFGCFGTGALKADTEEVKQLVLSCAPNSIHHHIEADNTELFVISKGDRVFVVVVVDGDLNVKEGCTITKRSYGMVLTGFQNNLLPFSLHGILRTDDVIFPRSLSFCRNNATEASEVNLYGFTITL